MINRLIVWRVLIFGLYYPQAIFHLDQLFPAANAEYSL